MSGGWQQKAQAVFAPAFIVDATISHIAVYASRTSSVKASPSPIPSVLRNAAPTMS
eukprot:m.472477 g.472477  ORF g.472477 m.472477 type:complete len:56 (+) comp32783_c0_seq1:84-251(+)